MQGISSKAASSLENKKKYQQYEWNTDFDLDVYESFYRTHDPQIGRFLQVDPAAPNFYESPYVSMGNNPVSNIDPLGNSWWDVVFATIISVVDNLAPGSNLRAQYQPTDPDDYNNALRSADAAMLTVGAAMMVDGTRNMGGGVVLLAAGGAGAPVILAGATEFALGQNISVNATLNIAKGYNYGKSEGGTHGNSVDSDKPTQSYENTHESGKTYNGVGDVATDTHGNPVAGNRANASAKEKALNNKDPLVSQKVENHPTRKDALKAEDRGIIRNGGAGNKARNYNKRNSPGAKLRLPPSSFTIPRKG